MLGVVLVGLLCGCGTQTDGLVFVGENAAGISGEEDPPQAHGESAPPEPAAEEISLIYVYVCGAVNNPGVVALPEGSRAEAALEAAGGFRRDAGTDCVNLAARVSDGEKLYFPTEEEGAELSEESGGDGLIDINRADAAALCTLPGIGESKAGDILRYREENGPFGRIEDIMKVPGIKESVYGKIRDRIKAE